MQEDAEARYREWEEGRWKSETELEEKRRREDRAHELQVLQLLTRSTVAPQSTFSIPHHHYQHVSSPQHNMHSFTHTPLHYDSSPTISPTPPYPH